MTGSKSTDMAWVRSAYKDFDTAVVKSQLSSSSSRQSRSSSNRQDDLEPLVGRRAISFAFCIFASNECTVMSTSQLSGRSGHCVQDLSTCDLSNCFFNHNNHGQ